MPGSGPAFSLALCSEHGLQQHRRRDDSGPSQPGGLHAVLYERRGMQRCDLLSLFPGLLHVHGRLHRIGEQRWWQRVLQTRWCADQPADHTGISVTNCHGAHRVAIDVANCLGAQRVAIGVTNLLPGATGRVEAGTRHVLHQLLRQLMGGPPLRGSLQGEVSDDHPLLVDRALSKYQQLQHAHAKVHRSAVLCEWGLELHEHAHVWCQCLLSPR